MLDSCPCYTRVPRLDPFLYGTERDGQESSDECLRLTGVSAKIRIIAEAKHVPCVHLPSGSHWPLCENTAIGLYEPNRNPHEQEPEQQSERTDLECLVHQSSDQRPDGADNREDRCGKQRKQQPQSPPMTGPTSTIAPKPEHQPARQTGNGEDSNAPHKVPRSHSRGATGNLFLMHSDRHPSIHRRITDSGGHSRAGFYCRRRAPAPTRPHRHREPALCCSCGSVRAWLASFRVSLPAPCSLR